MKTLTGPVARYLFAIPFAVFGIMHFTATADIAGLVPLPGATFFVFLSGLALISAAAAIIIDKMSRTAALLLALLIVTMALSAWPAQILAGNEQHVGTLLRDIALAGGALILAGTYEE